MLSRCFHFWVFEIFVSCLFLFVVLAFRGDYQRITFNQRILKKKIMMVIGEAIIHDGFSINESEDQGKDQGTDLTLSRIILSSQLS